MQDGAEVVKGGDVVIRQLRQVGNADGQILNSFF